MHVCIRMIRVSLWLVCVWVFQGAAIPCEVSAAVHACSSRGAVEAMADVLTAAMVSPASDTCFSKTSRVVEVKSDEHFRAVTMAEKRRFSAAYHEVFQHRDQPISDISFRELSNEYARDSLSRTYLRGHQIKRTCLEYWKGYNLGFTDDSAEVLGADLYVILPTSDSRWAIIVETHFCMD